MIMQTWVIILLLTNMLCVDKSSVHNQLFLNDQSCFSKQSDSLFVTKNLSVISASPCLSDLFQSIIKSNSKYYKSGESFYGLRLDKRKDYWYLEVFTDRLHGSKDTSYTSIIKFKDAVFLCSGDLQDSPFFYKAEAINEIVKLSIVRKPQIETMVIEPSLQGTLKACKGLPIYIEVFTVGPVHGFKMSIKH